MARGDIYDRPGGPFETYKIPAVVVHFHKPMTGYWNGTITEARFTPDPGYKTETPRVNVKWGSWAANYWFVAAGGKTWKVAAANAMKRLKGLTKRATGATYSIEWETYQGRSLRGGKRPQGGC